MLPLDYALCDRGDCPSAGTCDRYQTQYQLHQARYEATNQADRVAAIEKLSHLWYSDFQPNLETGNCPDYVPTAN